MKKEKPIVDKEIQSESVIDESLLDVLDDEQFKELSNLAEQEASYRYEETMKGYKKRAVKRNFIISISIIIFLIVLAIPVYLYIRNLQSKIKNEEEISIISEYIASSSDRLVLDDDTLTYTPVSYLESITSKQLVEMLYTKEAKQKFYDFEIVKITQKDNIEKREIVESITRENIVEDKAKFLLQVKFKHFASNQIMYQKLKLEINLSKLLFFYDENNNGVMGVNKVQFFNEIKEKSDQNSTSLEKEFYDKLNETVKNVYDQGKINLTYKTLFPTKNRTEIFKVTNESIENLLLKNSEIIALYFNNIKIDKDFNVKFIFHDPEDKKQFQIKANIGERINTKLINEVVDRISTPSDSYYVSNANNKVKVDRSPNYDIVAWTYTKNEVGTPYNFSGQVSLLEDDSLNEEETITELGLTYNVIHIYPYVRQVRANVIIRDDGQEFITQKNVPCGLVNNLFLDLTDKNINESNKYLDPADEYFYGWKIVNKNNEIIKAEDVKNGFFYNLQEDIIVDAIIKKYIKLPLSLPSVKYTYSPTDQNNDFDLFVNIKESDNVYDKVEEFRVKEISKMKGFSEDENVFKGYFYTRLTSEYLFKIYNYIYPLNRDIKGSDLAEMKQLNLYLNYKNCLENFSVTGSFEEHLNNIDVSNQLKALSLPIPNLLYDIKFLTRDVFSGAELNDVSFVINGIRDYYPEIYEKISHLVNPKFIYVSFNKVFEDNENDNKRILSMFSTHVHYKYSVANMSNGNVGVFPGSTLPSEVIESKVRRSVSPGNQISTRRIELFWDSACTQSVDPTEILTASFLESHSVPAMITFAPHAVELAKIVPFKKVVVFYKKYVIDDFSVDYIFVKTNPSNNISYNYNVANEIINEEKVNAGDYTRKTIPLGADERITTAATLDPRYGYVEYDLKKIIKKIHDQNPAEWPCSHSTLHTMYNEKDDIWVLHFSLNTYTVLGKFAVKTLLLDEDGTYLSLNGEHTSPSPIPVFIEDDLPGTITYGDKLKDLGLEALIAAEITISNATLRFDSVKFKNEFYYFNPSAGQNSYQDLIIDYTFDELYSITYNSGTNVTPKRVVDIELFVTVVPI